MEGKKILALCDCVITFEHLMKNYQAHSTIFNYITQRNNVIMIDLTKNDFTFEDIRQYL